MGAPRFLKYWEYWVPNLKPVYVALKFNPLATRPLLFKFCDVGDAKYKTNNENILACA